MGTDNDTQMVPDEIPAAHTALNNQFTEERAMREAIALLALRRSDHETAYRKKKWREIKTAIQPLSNVLNVFFKDRPQVLKKVDESAAIMAWKEVVGESTARFSEAIRFRGQTLVVRVSDAIWMQQLSLLKTSLLRGYQQKFPQLKIKDIYFTRS